MSIEIVNSVEDLRGWIVQGFLSELLKSKKNVILLNGPMGVGKTQWVKLFVEELFKSKGFKNLNSVSSPTFSLQNTYQTNGLLVHHFDLYRLESESDLESFNFWDAFSEDNAYIVIEWSKKFSGLDFFPGWKIHNIDLNFKKGSLTTRELKYFY